MGPRGEPSMLLTKLEKLLFLLLPVGGLVEPLPSLEYRLGLGMRSLSLRFWKKSMRFCSAVKLADCLRPRGAWAS